MKQLLNGLEEDLSYVPKRYISLFHNAYSYENQRNKRPFKYDYAMLAGETINAEAVHQLLDGYGNTLS
ncbi:hypothetical protein NXV15_24055 [Bacteroides thetaiotaomicron]|nr:hypothetical protein [Bacteroides thetaiotaomicron]MCS2687417.1 hypothetical protein [Bacteroides thetaiotaomicron]